ncbi:MAG: type I-MYXAN CRISPR-associated Cas8a1/Cmx1 [Desulfitobacteriaceae bacterium]
MGEWTFRLNAVGMTALHKAGLVGLGASLNVLKEKELLQDITFSMNDQSLSIEGLEKNAEGLHRLLSMMYEIDNGLINFPLIRDWTPSRRAKLQQLLRLTFLQHPSSNLSEKTARVIQDPIDGGIIEYNYLPLVDLRHRYSSVCQEWESKLTSHGRIEIKGWAYPGAMKRHEKVGESVLTDDPELYPLLLCAPLGCLYFKGIAYDGSGGYDSKTQAFLSVPCYNSLNVQAQRLERFYRKTMGISEDLIAVTESDAVLQSAIYLEVSTMKRYLSTQLSVYRFGKVPWSKQKTRTGVYHTLAVLPQAVGQYEKFLNTITIYTAKSSNGGTYSIVFPARGLIAENLIRERPWYQGFTQYMADKRYQKVRIWSKELNDMVNDQNVWTDEMKRQFVLLFQDGIRKRYGKVSDQAEKSSSDPKSAFKREYEKIRVAFSHCRTREQLRRELADFLAKTRAKVAAASHENEMDLFLLVSQKENDWQELRDLCLLALASYRGKGLDSDLEQQLEQNLARDQAETGD